MYLVFYLKAVSFACVNSALDEDSKTLTVRPLVRTPDSVENVVLRPAARLSARLIGDTSVVPPKFDMEVLCFTEWKERAKAAGIMDAPGHVHKPYHKAPHKH